MGNDSALRISASGMTAQRMRLDVIANNLANAETTRSASGGPYRRQQVLFAAKQNDIGFEPSAGKGVEVVGVTEDTSPPRIVHDPGHPDADASGNVAYPNVNPIVEMVDMMDATRAYEANAAAIEAFKAMAGKALEILR